VCGGVDGMLASQRASAARAAIVAATRTGRQRQHVPSSTAATATTTTTSMSPVSGGGGGVPFDEVDVSTTKNPRNGRMTSRLSLRLSSQNNDQLQQSPMPPKIGSSNPSNRVAAAATASDASAGRRRRKRSNWRPRLSFQPTDENGEPLPVSFVDVSSPNDHSNTNTNTSTNNDSHSGSGSNDNSGSANNTSSTSSNVAASAITVTVAPMLVDPLAQRKQLASSMAVVHEINRFWAVFEKMTLSFGGKNIDDATPNVVIGRDEFIHVSGLYSCNKHRLNWLVILMWYVNITDAYGYIAGQHSTTIPLYAVL
jgi:hypothetical protein